MKSTILCKSIIYYQVLKVAPRKLKKLQRDDRFNIKINLEIVSYLSIKVLDLFTSEIEYLVIKVSRKIGIISILCLFLDGTSSKIKSSLEKGVKISHPVFYHADYMRISFSVACL